MKIYANYDSPESMDYLFSKNPERYEMNIELKDALKQKSERGDSYAYNLLRNTVDINNSLGENIVVGLKEFTE